MNAVAGLSAGLFLLWVAAISIDLHGARCSLVMYLRDMRYLSALVNATLYLCTPKVGRRPLLPIDSKIFPHLGVFRENWQQIAEEARRVCEPAMARSDRGFAFKDIGNAGWRQFFIAWYGPVDPVAREFCPTTSRLVEAAPEIKIAFFSIVEPQSHIKPHVGPFRGVLRYQMGLRTPNDARCYISVNGISHTYRDGHDVIFDDTYVHAVHNGTDERRVILFLDIERPYPGRIAGVLNHFVVWTIGLFPAKSNAATFAA